MDCPLLNCSGRPTRYFWSLCKRFDRQDIWSCARLMSQLTFDNLYDNFQVNFQAACLFFDLEKAKVTNWWYGIRDIHRIGLRGRLPIFVSEYLRDRRIRVRIGTTLWRILPRGRFSTWWCTGQGMFGPKINEMPSCITRDIFRALFVGDLVICFRGRFLDTIERHLS